METTRPLTFSDTPFSALPFPNDIAHLNIAPQIIFAGRRKKNSPDNRDNAPKDQNHYETGNVFNLQREGKSNEYIFFYPELFTLFNKIGRKNFSLTALARASITIKNDEDSD